MDAAANNLARQGRSFIASLRQTQPPPPHFLQTFVGVTEEGQSRNVVAQVVDVSQALLSVKKCVKAGNRVVFDDNGSYTENKTTGEVTWMTEHGNLWVIKMWVKKGF